MNSTYKPAKENKKLFLELYLGILSAFAPFVMDMYLASMPELAQYFATTPANVQLSLATCVLGLAVGQLFIGTLSDSTGRKLPIIISLIVYLGVTVGCLLSPGIYWFVALRFAQGVAASGGVVISRSIVADCYRGSELSKMYGVVGMINGVATVLAPVFGGFIAVAWGWKGVFTTLMAFGALMFPCTVYFKETLQKGNRIAISPHVLFQTFRTFLTKPKFLLPCLSYSLLMSLIIVNLSSAPFIMDRMGMSESGISLTLGANAIALAITALLSSRFPDQKKVLRFSALVIVLGAAATVTALWVYPVFFMYELGVLVIYLGLGCLNTASVTLTMDAGRTSAGAASALLGTLGYLAGGIATVLESAAEPFTSTPWLFITLSAVVLLLSRVVKRCKTPKS